MKNLKDMLNESRGDDKVIEKKAEELLYCVLKEHNWDVRKQITECAMLMAEWMKSYMAEKAVKWLNEVVEDNQSKYVWYDAEEGYAGIEEELIDDFKKAMEK